MVRKGTINKGRTPERSLCRTALDAARFAERVLGITPDPWQRQVLNTPARRIILNCARQVGKSTVAAILALHRACYWDNALILVVAPSLRQSRELFRKIAACANQALRGARPIEDSADRLTLSNGSRIVALPGNEATIRGFSAPTLVIEDEAARVQDDLYRALRPMLATSGGALLLMSTPCGERGHFFEEWTAGVAWERISIPAADCPRIPDDFLAEERTTLGDRWFRQEYECQFTADAGQLFTREALMRCFTTTVRPLAEQYNWRTA